MGMIICRCHLCGRELARGSETQLRKWHPKGRPSKCSDCKARIERPFDYENFARLVEPFLAPEG